MTGDDERFEDYLREFTPRAPGALPGGKGRALGGWRRFAAAAAVLLAIGASVWIGWRRNPQKAIDSTVEKGLETEGKAAAARVSLGQLNQIALRQPARLDAQLAEESRAVLPDFRGEASTLRVLAKE